MEAIEQTEQTEMTPDVRAGAKGGELVALRTDSGVRGDALDREDDDEDEYEDSFTHVDALAGHGAQQADINKLLNFEFANCRLIASASKRELAEVPGISDERAENLKKKAKQADARAGLAFATALELSKTTRSAGLSTGSANLDRLLGGGLEQDTITSVYGDSGTGKTQLCLTLCVRAQMAEADGGAEGRALYVDCNHTFRAERVAQIAAAHDLGAEQTLANITYVKVSSFDEQQEAIQKASNVMADTSAGEYRLVVVDGLMTHLRAEYAGRGELAARQQSLNIHMRKLKLMADAFNVAVVVTNQVTMVPEQFGTMGPTVKPIGGPVLAHNISTKIFLRKGRGSTKKVIIEQSPRMPKDECLISITAAGVVDPVEE